MTKAAVFCAMDYLDEYLSLIHISGGVGIPYRPEQTENDIMAIVEGVRKKFEEILVPAGMGCLLYTSRCV